MPYGIRCILTAHQSQMLPGARCWLRVEEDGAPQFLGFSPSKNLVAFEGDLGLFKDFTPKWFVSDDHPRLAFPSRKDALMKCHALEEIASARRSQAAADRAT